MSKFSDQNQSCTGLLLPSDRLEDICNNALTLSLSTFDDTGKVFVLAKNLSGNQITPNNQSEIAHSQILNEPQADNVIEIDPHLISLAKMSNPVDFEGELNQLKQDFHFTKIDTPTGRPHLDYSKLWFPTPGNCKESPNSTPLQREIYYQVLKFQRQEKIPKYLDADKLKIFDETFMGHLCRKC